MDLGSGMKVGRKYEMPVGMLKRHRRQILEDSLHATSRTRETNLPGYEPIPLIEPSEANGLTGPIFDPKVLAKLVEEARLDFEKQLRPESHDLELGSECRCVLSQIKRVIGMLLS